MRTRRPSDSPFSAESLRIWCRTLRLIPQWPRFSGYHHDDLSSCTSMNITNAQLEHDPGP
jgi:hypothetical protein